MCTKAIDSCRFDTYWTMDSSATAADEPTRVKFLCSFGGGILPRPLDGRLRYIGGETRIVCVPRDISFNDLIARMRELFEGTAVIKYQQPDEDIDALVSVVNDDDVTNMMEEYDKLGSSSDGFTRLRIFLFSQQHQEHEAAVAAAATTHFETDERETERRYVQALNNSLSSPDVVELNAPHMEPPWSPMYFSPNRHPSHDPREFPGSPSSARHHLASGELNDRIPAEEYFTQLPAHQPGPPAQHDHQPFMENVVWLPPGAIVQENSGFPTNLSHAHMFDGSGGGGNSSICEHCHLAFQRNQVPMSDPRFLDPRWKQGQQPHIEANTSNEYMGYFSNSCTDCSRSREGHVLNHDVKLDHGVYVKELGEQHPLFYIEAQGYEKGWPVHRNPESHRIDPRMHHGGVRVGEHYVVESNAQNVPLVHGNFYDGHPMPSSGVNHEFTSETLQAHQTLGSGHHTHILGLEDASIRYSNQPPTYGTDNFYQHNLAPIQSLRRKPQVSLHPGAPNELPGLMMPNGGINSGFIRSPQGGSPRLSRIGVENQIQNLWALQNSSTSQKILGFDGFTAPEYLYEHVSRANQNMGGQDGRIPIVPNILHVEIPSELASPVPTLVNDKLIDSLALGFQQIPNMGTDLVYSPRVVDEKNTVVRASETKHEGMLKEPELDSNKLEPIIDEFHASKLLEFEANVGGNENGDLSVECLSFLPELIASAKKAALKSAEVVKARVEADNDEKDISVIHNKESSLHELEPQNACAEEADSDGDGRPQQISKIEPSTAEAEALAKGLQTIRNDDLEEIRELGSGTYGSVYHGKWKGSDVAIKRIKASCFSGRPSERERLIADFWKEALILSSLHHPNIVSFYGVVRDGPDGSLATLTEFMVNGSLKQFLQKKDRTIDRRKRLIIAMDAAFGMEYLHEKNIVHFDLKCENLLVNMRDPHRPVCKIGDLGLSKVKQHTLVSGGVRGTLPWMAPELLSGKSNMVTEKIDVYSFGIVMWELLTGEEPYADMRCADVIGGIVNNVLRPQIPTWCDPEWKSLMGSCWSSDPGARPSFSEISQKLRKMSAAINVK